VFISDFKKFQFVKKKSFLDSK